MLCSFLIPTIETSVTGHLRSKSHKDVSGFTVFVKGTGVSMIGLDMPHTDKNGNFILAFNVGSEPGDISFYFVNKLHDTLLLNRVNHLISETTEMTFWIK
ncbi:hypothetical protein CJD36_005385 [Flavipsychrobacter stenotrophus]|uniref:Uncharacterized protein n=1 Tax=Flavipsychrobacter stenotrophus TaxID=2077091 RepID=A0A2S7SWD4_9BACT|nr:hypothetical protein CJD36_005385 [Flavipsychrobacter stenotrophus]